MRIRGLDEKGAKTINPITSRCKKVMKNEIHFIFLLENNKNSLDKFKAYAYQSKMESTQTTQIYDMRMLLIQIKMRELARCDDKPDEILRRFINAFIGCAERGDEEGVRLFLESGIELASFINGGFSGDPHEVQGYTALHAAAGQKNVRVVEMLLDAGADVNVAVSDCVTPLSIAVINHRTENRDLLIRRGASLENSKTWMGKMLVECVEELTHPEN